MDSYYDDYLKKFYNNENQTNNLYKNFYGDLGRYDSRYWSEPNFSNSCKSCGMNRNNGCSLCYDVFAKKNHDSQDIIYMRKMYPKMMRQIQQIVDEECDKLEYNGSMMYDEYPDRLMLDKLNCRIAKRVETDCSECMHFEDKEMLKGIVAVILCNELCRRRSDRRRW